MSHDGQNVPLVQVAHNAQNALATGLLHVRLLYGDLERGNIDLAQILTALTEIETQLIQGIDLVGVLQARGIIASDRGTVS